MRRSEENGGVRLLVVDDDRALRDVLRRALTLAGYEVVLTARDAVSDRIDGLDAGADDYLVKPFDIDELKARLRALLRRAGGEAAADGALSFAELRLDPDRHGAWVV